MARDNLSLLFAAASPPASRPSPPRSAHLDQSGVREPSRPKRSSLTAQGGTTTSTHDSSTSAAVEDDGSATGRGQSDGELIVDFAARSPASTSAPPADDAPSNDAKPGTESIQYLKRFGSNLGSIAMRPLRELQLAEKLNSMNLEIEEMQNQKECDRMRRQLEELEAQDRAGRGRDKLAGQSEQLARELQDQEDEEECERIKMDADMACQRVDRLYDALLEFVRSCPHGTYEEFIEFMLMGGGRREDVGVDYNSLMFENFYGENSQLRRVWNDNLTMGLPDGASTLEERSFVPAAGSAESNKSSNPGQSITDTQQRRTFSSDEKTLWQTLRDRTSSEGDTQHSRTFSSGEKTLGQTLRERTFSEGERLTKQIATVDSETIKQGLGSAVGAISNATAFALKPLRDLQLAEQINAVNIEREEEAARREIEKYNRLQEEDRDMEEMKRLKREAEERCLDATRVHLSNFTKNNPHAKYSQWIEDFHPENAHDGALLEGLGKTIDHRFYVEESDHRRLWNENALSEGRDFVPARARQTNGEGETVVPVDILSGSLVGREAVAPQHQKGKKSEDLISFSFD